MSKFVSCSQVDEFGSDVQASLTISLRQGLATLELRPSQQLRLINFGSNYQEIGVHAQEASARAEYIRNA